MLHGQYLLLGEPPTVFAQLVVSLGTSLHLVLEGPLHDFQVKDPFPQGRYVTVVVSKTDEQNLRDLKKFVTQQPSFTFEKIVISFKSASPHGCSDVSCLEA